MNNAPKKFLHLYLPGALADAIDKITQVQAGSYVIQKLLLNFGGNGGKRYASFLKIGKSKNQQEVFLQLRQQYSDDATFKFVALTMDMEKCGAGPSLSGYEGQLEEILAVKRQFPDSLLLFLGVDPRWKLNGNQLRDTVAEYFEKKLVINEKRSVYPFVGIKIYPSTGFYPFDERLMKTFEWAAENNVPVLSHCNYLGGIFNNNQTYIDAVINSKDPYNHNAPYPMNRKYEIQKRFGRWIIGRQTATNNLHRCSYFMEPNAFKSLLSHFEQAGTPLKLCLAHFGGGNQIKRAFGIGKPSEHEDHPYGELDKNWFLQIKGMMSKFPNLYTDISYSLYDKRIHKMLLSEIENETYGSRIMFGTDFFLTEREGPELDTYRIFKESAIAVNVSESLTAWDRVANISTERFLQSKYYNREVI